jgi:diguanylate cyclase (GGDEF)-like protein
MFNYSSLPDLIALTVLVGVFWSILRRRAAGQLYGWLVAWILILLHFAIALFGGPGPQQAFALCLSEIMLDLAAAAFIYAAGQTVFTTRFRGFAAVGVTATVLYIVFDWLSLTSPVWYYSASAILALAGLAFFVEEEEPVSWSRPVYGGSTLVLAAVLGALAHFKLEDYGADSIFFVMYLLAGYQYWRAFPQRTTGAVTAAIGFIAWACVFPSAVLLAILTKVHVQASVWNLPKYIVAIGILLTLLEQEITRTEHLALHDPLTGLPNRRLLQDRLTKAVERAERNEARLAVLLIDLDNFKQINDTYGHAVGDEVLRVVATRLQMRIRKADTIARAGGDEFLVVVSDLLQPHGADILAGKLMTDLNEPIVLRDSTLRACASIGIAIYPDDGQTADALCEKADLAMYDQKRRGAEKSKNPEPARISTTIPAVSMK